MRKIVAVLLVLCVLLGTITCHAEKSATKEPISKVDILTNYQRDAQGTLLFREVVRRMFTTRQRIHLADMLTRMVDFTLLCIKKEELDALTFATEKIDYLMAIDEIVQNSLANERFGAGLTTEQFEVCETILESIMTLSLMVAERSTWESSKASERYLEALMLLLDVCCIEE